MSEAGCIARAGQIADASRVSAPRQRNTEAETKAGRVPSEWRDKPAKLRQKDRDALWTLLFGKARLREDGTQHAARSTQTSRSRSSATRTAPASTAGMASSANDADASRHDGRMLRRGLLDRTKTGSTARADGAYRSKATETFMAKRGFRSWSAPHFTGQFGWG